MKTSQIFRLFILVSALIILATGVASAATTTGTWELYPPQASVNSSSILQPINVDGSSNFKSNGKSVIPVQFQLLSAPGPVVFQSIGTDGDTANDFSYLSFTPNPGLTFNQITSLMANYTFSQGDCHGGALRWSVRTSATQSVFIYYGAAPNFTDCTTTNQSGVNMIGQSDLRYDTSQVGGTFYDTYAHAQALVGTLPVIRVSLVLDGGWAGDQVATVSNVTVNDNAFVPLGGPAAKVCTLPPANIKITKLSGAASGDVNEPETIQPNDNNGVFRVVDCKYMYNLATSSLFGVGSYKVEVVIGTPVPGAAFFDLR